jgi:hypothetical protein
MDFVIGNNSSGGHFHGRPLGAYVGINRRLLLGSTVGFCWDRLSALSVGSCWDRPSASLAGIDRKLQGELC